MLHIALNFGVVILWQIRRFASKTVFLELRCNAFLALSQILVSMDPLELVVRGSLGGGYQRHRCRWVVR